MKVQGYDFDKYPDAYAKAFYYDRWERDHEDEFDYRKMLSEIKPKLAEQVNGINFNKEFCTSRTGYFGEYTFDQKPYPNSFRFKITDTTDRYYKGHLEQFDVVYKNGFEFNHFKMLETKASSLIDSRKSRYNNSVNRRIYLKFFYKIENSKKCAYTSYSTTYYRLCAQITRVLVYSHEGGELFATLYPNGEQVKKNNDEDNASFNTALSESEQQQIESINAKYEVLTTRYRRKHLVLAQKAMLSLDTTTDKKVPTRVSKVAWIEDLKDSVLKAIKTWESLEQKAPANSYYALGPDLIKRLDSTYFSLQNAFENGEWVVYYNRLYNINRFCQLLASSFSESDGLYAFCSNELLFSWEQISFFEVSGGTVYGKRLNGSKAKISRNTLFLALNTLYEEAEKKLMQAYPAFERNVSNDSENSALRQTCRRLCELITGYANFTRLLNAGEWGKVYSAISRNSAIIKEHQRRVLRISHQVSHKLDSSFYRDSVKTLTTALLRSIDSIQSFNQTNLEGTACSIQGLRNYPMARDLYGDLLIFQYQLLDVHSKEKNSPEVLKTLGDRSAVFRFEGEVLTCRAFGKVQKRPIGLLYTADLSLVANELLKEFQTYGEALESLFRGQQTFLEGKNEVLTEKFDEFKRIERLYKTINDQEKEVQYLEDDFQKLYKPREDKKAINPKVYEIGLDVLEYLEQRSNLLVKPEEQIEHNKKLISVLNALVLLLDEDHKKQEKAIRQNKGNPAKVIEMLLAM